MPPLDKRRLISTLGNKVGGEEVPQRDHVWFRFYVGGIMHATTKVSRGSKKDIAAPVVQRVASQIGLTSRQLADLVSCDMDTNAFYTNLAAKGILVKLPGL